MSDHLLLGTRKGLLFYERTDAGWRLAREEFRGIPISYAIRDPRDGVLWAAQDNGHWGPKLQRSRDNGETWEEIILPKYPEGAEITEGNPANLSYIWAVFPGSPSRPERVYLGTEPGGLFQSDDGGQSFELVEGLWNHPSRMKHWFGGGRDHPGLHSLVIDPADDDHMFVGISVAGVFETRDGGVSWQPRNQGLKANYLPDPDAEVGHDPHCLVASPADPEVMIQQNHCGIFWSNDGARSWSEVSEAGGPAFFGFAIAADELDPATAWVVPAVSDELRLAVDGSLCVCRTQDRGRTWQALRKGLPQKDCYDYAYRHALDIRGDRLAFGTTSGNLYLSDDRGDSWATLAGNLPMIYSVRFL
ncbi:MAG: sialidase family protein [Anaerolineales bacterium]|nr:sialidase family protein [Anaerolineales bacterium]